MGFLAAIGAVGGCCFVLAVGVVAHELSHAVALRAGGVPCRVEVLPAREDAGGFPSSAIGPLARVTPTHLPANLPVWRLRVAAMTPFSLAIPVVLLATDVVPVPVTLDSPSLDLVAIAWLACSLPSPRDFSLLWYPERATALARQAGAVGP